jgi:segregation and condensation protein A
VSYRIQLDNYEGPVELLLYLIRRDELDILAIPIARITDEYLGYIRSIAELDLDNAADFIYVITILLRLKIRSLLPRTPDEEGESAGTLSLADILQELAQYKRAAELLSTMEEQRRQLFPRPGEHAVEIETEETGDLYELALAFQMILQRAVKDEGWELNLPEVRLDEKMAMLKDLLGKEKKFFFSTVLKSCRSVQEMVVVFIAVLELVRLGEVWLRQEGAFRDIIIRRRLKPVLDKFAAVDIIAENEN